MLLRLHVHSPSLPKSDVFSGGGRTAVASPLARSAAAALAAILFLVNRIGYHSNSLKFAIKAGKASQLENGKVRLFLDLA